MSRIALGTLFLVVTLAGGNAAHADSGFYVGGGFGQTWTEDDPASLSGASFDEEDVAWRAFVGYRLDIPIIDLAGEVGYRDLGDPSGTVLGQSVEYTLTAWDISVLGIFALGPIDLYGRVGAVQYDLEKNINGVVTDFDGTAPLYAIGAGLTIWKIGVRLEYERVEIDELEKSDTLWLTALFRF